MAMHTKSWWVSLAISASWFAAGCDMDPTGSGPADASIGDTSRVDVPPPNLAHCLPPCLVSIFQDCLPLGNCLQQFENNNNGPIFHMCYANHVRADTMPTDGGAIRSVYSQSGRTCYYLDQALTNNGSDSKLTFFAPDGATVAVVPSITASNLQVMCNGTTYTLDDSNPDCTIPSGSSSCVAGPCHP
jgi:hypothetical protein